MPAIEQTPVRVIARQKVAGTAFASFTTAKSMLNAAAVAALQPNSFYGGKRLRITVIMALSNIVTAQPTFTFQVMIGSVVVWSSGAVIVTTTAHVNYPVKLVIDLRIDTEGSGTAASIIGIGELTGLMFVLSGAVADPTAGMGKQILPNSAPVDGTGFDSSIANNLDFWAGISVSQPTNGVQVLDYIVEDLSPAA
jgi:hypothetical protein